jgi:hypothetical protein
MVTEMLYIFNVQSNEINSWNAKHRKPIWFPGEHKHAGRNENFGPVSRPQKKKKKIPVFSPETNTSYADLGSKATDHFKIEKMKLRVKKKDLLKRNAIQGLWRPDESIYIAREDWYG